MLHTPSVSPSLTPPYSVVVCTVLCHLVLTAHSYSPQLKLQFQTQRSVPVGMVRGGAVVHHNIVYCVSSSSYTVYAYQPDEDEWQEHSHCPHKWTGLAIIKDLLTVVGGLEEGRKTNKLLSWRDGRWEEVFPPMNTARWNHVVLSEDDYVIAVGGDGETSVELFTVSTNTWSTVTSLPQPLPEITATLSCNILYAMDWYGRTFSISMSHWTKNTSRELPRPHPIWQPLPHDAPFWASTLTTVCGEVMAVGGMRGYTATGNVYQLRQREWVRIGCMHTARRCPIVAVLRVPGHSMLVVGGSPTPTSPLLTAVELAVLC